MHRQVKAGAELLHHLDRLQALQRILAERLFRRREQIGVGLVMRASDAPAQLVQLREAELVRAIDDHGVGVRIVDAGLDDRGAEKEVHALRGEVAHHALELALGHLAVREREARLGQQAGEPLAHALDRLHFVVQEVDLAAALQLAHHRLADQALGERRDERLDRQSLLGRRGDDRKVADAFQRHGERARDRRRGKREHVDVGAQPLQRLLLAHAEAMLLVDDDEAHPRQLDVAAEQLVRADDDIELALRQPREDFIALLRRLEARELRNAHRPLGEAVVERLEVLLGKERGRAKHDHLLVIRHRDESGAQRDLGLAEAHIAADQAVHGLARGHVAHHGLDGGGLVRRLLEAEPGREGFQIVLPDAEGVSMA